MPLVTGETGEQANTRPRPGAGAQQGERIIWLDCLRALAVLLVVWGHIFVVGISDPKTVSLWIPSVHDAIFGPGSPSASPHFLASLAMWVYLGINPGALGVAIFFLVSGFVILRTLDRMSPSMFLARRAIRILPVCAVAVVATAIFENSLFVSNGAPPPNTLSIVIISSVAMSGFFSVVPTIPVLWTLTVELLFYALMAAAAGMVGKRVEFNTLAVLGLACLGFVLLVNAPGLQTMLFAEPALGKMVYLSELAVYISFMLIGSMVYRGYSDRRILAAAAWVTFAGAVFFASHFAFGQLKGTHLGIGIADARFAFILFVAALVLNLRGTWTAPIRWIADISYPLYLVHIPLGWAVLAWLGFAGWGMNVAGLGATAVVLAVAWGMHLGVEQPAHHLGRWVGRRGRRLTFADSAVIPAHPGQTGG